MSDLEEVPTQPFQVEPRLARGIRVGTVVHAEAFLAG